jgi:signal transduction histidine kinase
VILEMESADHRRRGRERVERAAVVGHELRIDVTSAADAAARLVLGFEDEDRPAGVSQQVRRDEAVRSRPDDDRVNAHLVRLTRVE